MLDSEAPPQIKKDLKDRPIRMMLWFLFALPVTTAWAKPVHEHAVINCVSLVKQLTARPC